MRDLDEESADIFKLNYETDMKQSWEMKRLGELCQIKLGKTPYRGDKSNWDTEKETENVWLSIADLLNTDGNFVSDSKE